MQSRLTLVFGILLASLPARAEFLRLEITVAGMW